MEKYPRNTQILKTDLERNIKSEHTITKRKIELVVRNSSQREIQV